jgi:hypothetical protein
MKILLLLLVLTSSNFFSNTTPLFANKKLSSPKPKAGGRFYRSSKISLTNSPITANFKGDSYQAFMDHKGVFHIFLKKGDGFDRKAAILGEIMWVDGKNKKADEALLTSASFKEKAPDQWNLSGSFGDIKGSFEMNMKFNEKSIEIFSDASAKKSGGLKITFTVTNLSSLYKKDSKKTTEAAKKVFFNAMTTKKKKYETDYNKGELNKTAMQKFNSIELKNHFPTRNIQFDASKAEGHVDIKAYGGGSYLKEGFNIRYQTSSSGKMDLAKNKLVIQID